MKLKRFDYRIKETKTKPIIISSIVVLILLTGITIYATQARYKVTNTYNLLSGKVGYFVKPKPLSTLILANAEANNYLYTKSPNFTMITQAGKYGLYQAADDYGTSYYFRGDVENNYVEFGTYKAGSTVNGTTYTKETPMYWRIVRINGNGTIRLIYDGTELVDNGTTHTAILGIEGYNTTYDDPKYVGYTYDDGAGTQIDSTIKGVLESWYETNLEGKYGKYIADSVFCNDREVTSTSSTYQYYGAYDRLYKNKNPKLNCTQETDKYTVNSSNGNGLLKHPIGLITADEVLMAGGLPFTSNQTFYLGGTEYWTMSSHNFSISGHNANMWLIRSNGALDYTKVNLSSGGVRPVINLKTDSLFKGSGTITDPYKLVAQ